MKDDEAVIKPTTAVLAANAGSVGWPAVQSCTVPAVPTSARHANRAVPVGNPAASETAEASTQVTATDPTVVSEAFFTDHRLGFVAAATASA